MSKIARNACVLITAWSPMGKNGSGHVFIINTSFYLPDNIIELLGSRLLTYLVDRDNTNGAG